jgi:DNA-binding CsgD family transcriptional regulator
MTRTIDISHEFLICRYHNGIKLMPREIPGISAVAIKSVTEMLNSPFNVYFQTSNAEVQELNNSTVITCGYESRADAIHYPLGKTAINKTQVLRVHANNNYVVSTQQRRVFDEHADLLDEKSLRAISVKMPWYDKANKVIGIFGCSVVMHDKKPENISAALSTILNMFLSNRTVQETHQYDFSPREIEVIKLVIRGNTLRGISVLLGLSLRTVEFYFDNIKSKVGVNKKSKLIDKLIDQFV